MKLIEFPPSKLSVAMQIVSKPIFAMAILSYPLIDTLRVFTIRILNGKSPFLADKNHIPSPFIGDRFEALPSFDCLVLLYFVHHRDDIFNATTNTKHFVLGGRRYSSSLGLCAFLNSEEASIEIKV